MANPFAGAVSGFMSGIGDQIDTNQKTEAAWDAQAVTAFNQNYTYYKSLKKEASEKQEKVDAIAAIASGGDPQDPLAQSIGSMVVNSGMHEKFTPDVIQSMYAASKQHLKQGGFPKQQEPMKPNPDTQPQPGVPGQAPMGAAPAPQGSADPYHQSTMMAESGGDPNAVSPKGAEGSMQVMPDTQADPGFGVTPAASKDPQELQRVGDDYLDAMLKRYNGDKKLASMAYNWGPGNVDKWMAAGSDPSKVPAETQAYVQKVLGGEPEESTSTVTAERTMPTEMDAAMVDPAQPPSNGSTMERMGKNAFGSRTIGQREQNIIKRLSETYNLPAEEIQKIRSLDVEPFQTKSAVGANFNMADIMDERERSKQGIKNASATNEKVVQFQLEHPEQFKDQQSAKIYLTQNPKEALDNGFTMTDLVVLGAKPVKAGTPTQSDKVLAKVDEAELKKLDKEGGEAQTIIDNTEAFRVNQKSTNTQGPFTGWLPSTSPGAIAADSSSTIIGTSFSGLTKGAISDYEAKAFKQAAPSLMKSGKANEVIISNIQAIATRKQEKATFFRAWFEAHGSLNGAKQQWKKYLDENPIFDVKKGGDLDTMKARVPEAGEWSSYIIGAKTGTDEAPSENTSSGHFKYGMVINGKTFKGHSDKEAEDPANWE